MKEITFDSTSLSQWAGMGDFKLTSPDRRQTVILKYLGEPPFGDSYHSVTINEQELEGMAWGCVFAFSSDSRFLGFSWMKKQFERRTIVIDLHELKSFVLPHYVHDLAIEWPRVLDTSAGSVVFEFTGTERWKKLSA